MSKPEWTGLNDAEMDWIADRFESACDEARIAAHREHPGDAEAADAAFKKSENSIVSGMCAALLSVGCPVENCGEWAARILRHAATRPRSPGH